MASILTKLPGVALITGAGGTGKPSISISSDIRIDTNRSPGIGAAVAKAFARSGCTRLALTDINQTSLLQTRDSILQINPDAQITTLAGDISDDKFVTIFTEQVTGTFKRLDYAVNCAGILGESLRSHETAVEVFDRLNKVNYRGSWLVARAALGWMVEQEPLSEHPGQRGAVVNVASQLGIVARPGAGMLLD
jgi:NAD(P)-dependent dehydrogenase (short-subunit alcohol dehydrogenase family)